MDLRRRCSRGPVKKVQPWTCEDGATVTCEDGATVDLRRRCNRGPEKTVQQWT